MLLKQISKPFEEDWARTDCWRRRRSPALNERQLRGLFIGARFPADERLWAAAFLEKVRQIAERPPCPIES